MYSFCGGGQPLAVVVYLAYLGTVAVSTADKTGSRQNRKRLKLPAQTACFIWQGAATVPRGRI